MVKKIKDWFELSQNYKIAFGSPAGQAVLNDLSENFHLLAPTYTGGDPHHTAFLEGQRSVMLHVLQKLHWKQEDVENQIKEMM